MSDLFSAMEVAKAFNVSTSTLHSWVVGRSKSRTQLKGVVCGNARKFSESDVREWCKSNSIEFPDSLIADRFPVIERITQKMV
jgi:transposase